MEISGPEQWSSGDIAILQNQEAKKVRDIGSLIFETTIPHDYEVISSRRDSSGNRFVGFWVDSPLDVPMEERATIPARAC